MKKSNRTRQSLLGIALVVILIFSSCGSPGNQEATETQSPSTVTTAKGTSTELTDNTSPVELVTVNSTATLPASTQSAGDLIPVSGGGAEIQSPTTLTADELAVLQKLALPTDAIIKYTDDFKSSTSGWFEGKSDSSTVGYSGRNYYTVEILKKDTKYLVYLPNKLIYNSVNIDLKVKTEKSQDGDFDYGLVFRRSGDQFYAFTISPRSGKWYVLKSLKDSLKILKEGTVKDLQGLNHVDDNLRVSLRGTSFFFVVNGLLITQVSDVEYASGEVGLFVQSHDSSDALIDFDSIILWTVPVKNSPTPGPTLVTVATATLDCDALIPGGTASCAYGVNKTNCTCSSSAGYCTDPTAKNWKDLLPCKYTIYGCTNPAAANYDPNATDDDGSCYIPPPQVFGCTNPAATNYNPNATDDDGSCILPPPPTNPPPPPPTDPPPPPPTDPPPVP